MGARANLVVVEGGAWALRYSHWAANRLLRDLFWGPDHGLEFARRQRRVDRWLDERWCEGGAVLDRDARSLLLFGGPEDVAFDVELRAVYLDLLAAAWNGWRVGWAHERIVDLARAVGVDPGLVLVDELAPRPGSPRQEEWIETVVSVGDPEGLVRVFALTGQPRGLLANGPALLDRLAGLEPGLPPLEEPLEGGVHLVPHERRLEFWLAHHAPAARERVEEAWPGWEVTWLRDHRDAALRLPARPDQDLVADLERLLLAEHRDPVGAAISLQQVLRDEGRQVDVSPWVYAHADMPTDADRRRRVFSQAVDGRRARCGYR